MLHPNSQMNLNDKLKNGLGKSNNASEQGIIHSNI